jgi:hypothetical protein
MSGDPVEAIIVIGIFFVGFIILAHIFDLP